MPRCRQGRLASFVRPSNMAPAKFPYLALVLVLSPGCSRPITVAPEKIEEIVDQQYRTSFPCEIYYCGSEGGFDYFHEFPPSSTNVRGHRYRTPASGLIQNRFPYTSNPKQWRSVAKPRPVQTSGLTSSSTRTPPALLFALSKLLASSASLVASVQAGPVSFIR